MQCSVSILVLGFYITSSTPSIHLGGSFFVTPMAASGSRLMPDTRAIRSSTNLGGGQNTQTQFAERAFPWLAQDGGVHEILSNSTTIKKKKGQRYLIKLLMSLAESRAVPSEREEEWGGRKDAANSQPRKAAGNSEAFQNPSRLTHSDLNSRQGRTTCGWNLGKFTQSTLTLTFFTEARACGCWIKWNMCKAMCILPG